MHNENLKCIYFVCSKDSIPKGRNVGPSLHDAGRQEVGMCSTRGETFHIHLPNVSKAAHSDFETKRRYHQKSKKGAQIAHVYAKQKLQ